MRQVTTMRLVQISQVFLSRPDQQQYPKDPKEDWAIPKKREYRRRLNPAALETGGAATGWTWWLTWFLLTPSFFSFLIFEEKPWRFRLVNGIIILPCSIYRYVLFLSSFLGIGWGFHGNCQDFSLFFLLKQVFFFSLFKTKFFSWDSENPTWWW